MHKQHTRDLEGMVFGRLTVIERAETYYDGKNYRYYWRCKCQCGNEKIVREDKLCGKNSPTRSCGCARSDNIKKYYQEHPKEQKHGHSYERLFNIWYLMRYRCGNPSSPHYDRYGARGIRVCEEWDNEDTGYEAFKEWSISHGYSDNLSIDRIDNDKGYSPDNCRWADVYMQANNKRNNRRITYLGETKTASEWAREINMPYKDFMQRIRRGWSIEDVMTKPLRGKKEIVVA